MMKSVRVLGWVGVAVALFVASPASAQLRNHDLRFRPPSDARVIGFHVYVSANSMSYADYRDDINFLPATDSSGVATYRLTGLEQFDDVYLVMRSYAASGEESGNSNEIVLPGQQECLVTGCNDNNPCTVDTCGSNGCVFDPAPNRGQTCNDGNADTINDRCSTSGTCTGTVPQCVVDADCGGASNQCVAAPTCQNNMCVAGAPRPSGTTCNDGNAGTINDRCNGSGSCFGTVPQCIVDTDCPASTNACMGPQTCSNNMCVTGTPRADGTTCNDGNSSTRYDVCQAGTCRGFACGSDAQCNDGQGCNGVERCVSNTCVAGTPMVCNDGNRCNGTETCSGSACVAGTPMTCPTEDGPCFDAFCDPAQGCRVSVHPDGTTCTTATTSAAGMCASGVCVVNAPEEPPISEMPRDPRPSDDGAPSTCELAYGSPTDIHQALTSSPETSRKIVWSAPLHPMGSLLEYRADSVAGWTSLRAFPESSVGCDATWSVTLTGLKPRTRYYYRVSGASAEGRTWSETLSLRTNSVSKRERFKFAFFASNGLDSTEQSTQAEEVVTSIKKGGYPLVLGGGGYALSNEAMASGVAPDADAAVELWKEQAQPVTGNSIFVPVLGDTEVESSAHRERAADYAEFTGGMASTASSGSYAFDYAGVHFVGLRAPNLTAIHPGNTAGAAQLAWLDANLAAARTAGAQWLVVYLHADLFSSERTDPNAGAVRTALGAVLQRHGVNLVLSGEGNSYERTRALRGNLANPMPGPLATEMLTTDGVAFVRAGSGGRTQFGSWSSPNPPTWSAFRDNTRAVFLSVQASEKNLALKAWGLDVNGKRSVVDELTIRTPPPVVSSTARAR
jgi:hypothetical protein